MNTSYLQYSLATQPNRRVSLSLLIEALSKWSNKREKSTLGWSSYEFKTFKKCWCLDVRSSKTRRSDIWASNDLNGLMTQLREGLKFLLKVSTDLAVKLLNRPISGVQRALGV